MFDKMKDIWELKKKAEEIKKKLDAMKFSSEDNYSKVDINASMEVLSVQVKDMSDKEKLENSLTENLNKAMKNAKSEAAKAAMSIGLSK
ncbi:MAG: YbaB/EbfC family nucleoid-associated protein [Elusimicrobiota bacterium]